MSASYTIDLTEKDGSWAWRLYEHGGMTFIWDGQAHSIETAVDEAKTRMLVHHRQVVR